MKVNKLLWDVVMGEYAGEIGELKSGVVELDPPVPVSIFPEGLMSDNQCIRITQTAGSEFIELTSFDQDHGFTTDCPGCSDWVGFIVAEARSICTHTIGLDVAGKCGLIYVEYERRRLFRQDELRGSCWFFPLAVSEEFIGGLSLIDGVLREMRIRHTECDLKVHAVC